jgi:hypothetical protein
MHLTSRAQDEAAHARIASRQRLPRSAKPRAKRTPRHARTAHAVRRRALARAPQRFGTCQQIRDQRRDAPGRLRCAPTHLDALARSVADDQATVVSLVSEVADLSLDDGVEFRTGTATSRVIREQALYSGVRIAMDAAISTATVKFRMDVNFGDPITPAPGWVTLPPLRADMEPVRVLGYPVETVLAEKIATAIALGPANTRVRDYADIYTLTGIHVISHQTARQALLATATHRGTPVQPLSAAVGSFAELRRQTYGTYRTGLGSPGLQLPTGLESLVSAVADFADPLAANTGETTWQPHRRRWSRLPN